MVLWPFYHSERGSHLWDWFPGPFHHLLSSEEEIVAEVRASDRHPPEHSEYMLNEFLNLNRVTVDDLGRAIAEAGLAVRKLELMSEITHVPPGLEDYPLTTLGVSGVRLVATVREGS